MYKPLLLKMRIHIVYPTVWGVKITLIVSLSGKFHKTFFIPKIPEEKTMMLSYKSEQTAG